MSGIAFAPTEAAQEVEDMEHAVASVLKKLRAMDAEHFAALVEAGKAELHETGEGTIRRLLYESPVDDALKQAVLNLHEATRALGNLRYALREARKRPTRRT